VGRLDCDHSGRRDQYKYDTQAQQPAPALAPARLTDNELGVRGELELASQFNIGLHDGDTLHVTIMNVKVTRDETIPLHEQVAAEIRRDIAEGQVRPGQRLPPARDIAAVLGVHPNTVFRALRALRDEGILDFQRGRGVSVAGTPERSAVISKVRELIDFARAQGYRREDVVTMIETLR
jgi:GntR family transcriptional regulator